MASEPYNKAVRVLAILDREGMPPMSKQDWLTLIEAVIDGCEDRRAAVQDELRSQSSAGDK